MKMLATLVLSLLVTGIGAPAFADGLEDAEPFARVAYPLPPNNARGTLVKVQIQGPADDWGVRQFAEKMDDRWSGLRVRTYGTCDQRPSWVCVTVVRGSWDPDQQVAVAGGGFLGTTFNTGYDRTMYLNDYYLAPEYGVDSYAVAAHEFGHVLGLNHHQQDGICGAVTNDT